MDLKRTEDNKDDDDDDDNGGHGGRRRRRQDNKPYNNNNNRTTIKRIKYKLKIINILLYISYLTILINIWTNHFVIFVVATTTTTGAATSTTTATAKDLSLPFPSTSSILINKIISLNKNAKISFSDTQTPTTASWNSRRRKFYQRNSNIFLISSNDFSKFYKNFNKISNSQNVLSNSDDYNCNSILFPKNYIKKLINFHILTKYKTRKKKLINTNVNNSIVVTRNFTSQLIKKLIKRDLNVVTENLNVTSNISSSNNNNNNSELFTNKNKIVNQTLNTTKSILSNTLNGTVTTIEQTESQYGKQQITKQKRLPPSSSSSSPPSPPPPSPQLISSNPSFQDVNNVFEMSIKTKYNKLLKNIKLQQDQPKQQMLQYQQPQQLFRQQSINNEKGKVSLLGLFELSTRFGMRPEGYSELVAAQMAVKHINKRGLLPGYTLELLTNDTKCDPGVGIDRFFHALYTQQSTRMVMLLGSACSEVTESLAKVVPYWNIVQVSFGSTSPALSDRREFPLFYRTVAPDSSHNPARIAFIRRFGWDTITTFSQNEEVYSLAVNDLVTELESANISCAATITFARTDFKDQLKMLRDLDTRIIIGSFSHDLASKIFCEAYKLGMYGTDYVWILHETVGPPWWLMGTNECNEKELSDASENAILISSHNSIVGSAISFSGLTNTMFIEELQALNVTYPISRYAPQTYDAVWAIALALRGAEEQWRRNNSQQSKLDGFDYTRHDMANEFLQQFSRLKFLGISGPVSFIGADRIGTTAFYQIQNGYLQQIALYYPSTEHLDFVCPNCLTVKWQSGQVPIAKRIFKLRVVKIKSIAFYAITTIAIIGITLSVGFLAFNLHFRKLKTIKLSSPKLSNIIAVGCILVYTAVILLGLDYSTLHNNENTFSTICSARVYLLSSGFSLAFGSMFAKTYRVHRIFTHSGGGVCKDKMLQDTQLISLVCALLLLDGLVVTLWVITDPMERHLNNLTLEISTVDRSVVYQPQVEVCRSQYIQSWLGALYVYKGLLLIVGVYMAWETRHVKIPALNDSQYIGVSVYSVVITSAIVVVLANLIAERVTLAYMTTTALILTSTTATLCLLFLPKLNDIWSNGLIHDPVIHSMGLKMEYNTRRFVMDDKRELQYRVEVQNRVYKKEMAALDAEIQKLEKLLEVNSIASSSDLSTPIIFLPSEQLNDVDAKGKPRTPSIGGGLPLLLLSVLPPVIPRASWPSAAQMNVAMRRSVTFSSQPTLDDKPNKTDEDPMITMSRLPAIDLLNLRLSHQQATYETSRGIFDKIKGIFGSRPHSRKASATSFTGGVGGVQSGFAAAFKAHMGLLSGLAQQTNTLKHSSCTTLNVAASSSQTSTGGLTTSKINKTKFFTKSGSSINSLEQQQKLPNRNRTFSTAFTITGNSIKISSHDNLSPTFNINNNNEHQLAEIERTSSTTTVSETTPTTVTADVEQCQYVEIIEQPKVNFKLPANRRPSIYHQQSQPTLRERIKGSPRFPHRIVPTHSLPTLENRIEQLSDNIEPITLQQNHSPVKVKPKWKSMEHSTFITSTLSSCSTLPGTAVTAATEINIEPHSQMKLSSSSSSTTEPAITATSDVEMVTTASEALVDEGFNDSEVIADNNKLISNENMVNETSDTENLQLN